MKTFTIFMTDGSRIVVRAKRFRRDGDQYVFETDAPDEEVQFLKESEVKGILEGEFVASR